MLHLLLWYERKSLFRMENNPAKVFRSFAFMLLGIELTFVTFYQVDDFCAWSGSLASEPLRQNYLRFSF